MAIELEELLTREYPVPPAQVVDFGRADDLRKLLGTQRLSGITPEFALQLNRNMASYEDDTKIDTLRKILLHPNTPYDELPLDQDVTTMMDWSMVVNNLPQWRRTVLKRTLWIVSLYEDKTRFLPEAANLSLLEGWRQTDRLELLDSGFRPNFVDFMKTAVGNQSHS